MKLKYITIIFFLHAALVGKGQAPNIDIFYNELGEVNSNTYKRLVSSYNHFLDINYPDDSIQIEKTKKFLADVLKNQNTWSYDEKDCKTILTLMYKTNFRKDIYIYEKEMKTYPKFDIQQFLPKPDTMALVDLPDVSDIEFEDIIELPELTEEEKRLQEEYEKKHQIEQNRDPPAFNSDGLFIYALGKATPKDSKFKNYMESKIMAGDISPALIANGYLNYMDDASMILWYNQIPLIIDIYLYDILYRFSMNK